MKIRSFDTDKKVLVIAEIGNNHEGSYRLAKRLVRLAAKAGADAVKFQVIVPDELVSMKDKKRIRQLRRFQLSRSEYIKLHEIAKNEGVLFITSPFNLKSIEYLTPLVSAFKVASGDNNFFPLIGNMARTGKPLIVSTGMSTIDKIAATKTFIENIWKKQKIVQEMAILHCVSAYPVPSEEANLLAVRTLRRRFRCTVGYSDHTNGTDAAVWAVVLGARIIEKHFTINKHYSRFHDHALSATPEEFSLMVRKIRKSVRALGDGDKRLQRSERPTEKKARRSIVAACRLKKGDLVRWGNISWIRPGGGLEPGQEYKIVGKALKRSLKKGDMLLLKDLTKIKRKNRRS
ncbi:N-acetylneuraminate synthase family protein [Candidatus Omnitrophota bacterium]